MADEADIANAYIINVVNHAIEALGQRQQNNFELKPSAKFCRECGDEIPEARRKLGNIQLCVACAEETERRKALFANY